jgi:xylulokinase
MDSKLFLGLDCSTQTLKASVIDENLCEISALETIINYDYDLPQFQTKGGVLRGKDGLTVTTPTVVWLAALDLLFERMKQKNFPFHQIAAISGSGQQHGSVYWKKEAREKLKNLDSSHNLQSELGDCFSIQNSPIWMDSSTRKQCKELEHLLGGAEKVALLTGSVAYERFTINQIRKIYETDSEGYDNTERISLVSSFVCSLFVGDYAPIDNGDASGTSSSFI